MDEQSNAGDVAAESLVVIGFTEAELGLVIGALFMVLWMAARLSVAAPVAVGITLDSANVLRSELLLKTALLDSIYKADSTKNVSNLKGTCRWKGLTSGPIGTIRILDSRQFEHEGKVFPWTELAAHFAAELATAREANCTHQIEVRVDPSVPSGQSWAALDVIRQHFYYTRAR